MYEVIDTRDLVKELEEATDEDGTEETAARADTIRALFEEISGYAGDKPEDGIQLIEDSYFVDYARELADDIGAIDKDAKWPVNHIDWKEAADELKQDYTSVEFDGRTYWYR